MRLKTWCTWLHEKVFACYIYLNLRNVMLILRPIVPAFFPRAGIYETPLSLPPAISHRLSMAARFPPVQNTGRHVFQASECRCPRNSYGKDFQSTPEGRTMGGMIPENVPMTVIGIQPHGDCAHVPAIFGCLRNQQIISYKYILQ